MECLVDSKDLEYFIIQDSETNKTLCKTKDNNLTFKKDTTDAIKFIHNVIDSRIEEVETGMVISSSIPLELVEPHEDHENYYLDYETIYRAAIITFIESKPYYLNASLNLSAKPKSFKILYNALGKTKFLTSTFSHLGKSRLLNLPFEPSTSPICLFPKETRKYVGLTKCKTPTTDTVLSLDNAERMKQLDKKEGIYPSDACEFEFSKLNRAANAVDAYKHRELMKMRMANLEILKSQTTLERDEQEATRRKNNYVKFTRDIQKTLDIFTSSNLIERVEDHTKSCLNTTTDFFIYNRAKNDPDKDHDHMCLNSNAMLKDCATPPSKWTFDKHKQQMSPMIDRYQCIKTDGKGLTIEPCDDKKDWIYNEHSLESVQHPKKCLANMNDKIVFGDCAYKSADMYQWMFSNVVPNARRILDPNIPKIDGLFKEESIVVYKDENVGKQRTPDCYDFAKSNNAAAWGYYKTAHAKPKNTCFYYKPGFKYKVIDKNTPDVINKETIVTGCMDPEEKIEWGCNKTPTLPKNIQTVRGYNAALAHEDAGEGTAEECRQKSIQGGYQAWGHRSAEHGEEHYRNTCFLYKAPFGAFAPNSGDKHHIVGCNTPGLRPEWGCRATPPKYISFRSRRSGLWCGDNGELGILCNKPVVGPWETYEAIEHAGGYALRSGHTGKYCTHPYDVANIVCNKSSVTGNNEIFRFKPVHKEVTRSIQAAHNNLYCITEVRDRKHDMVCKKKDVEYHEQYYFSGL
jgi:hypothetical protein